jgi:hypothetical protein
MNTNKVKKAKYAKPFPRQSSHAQMTQRRNHNPTIHISLSPPGESRGGAVGVVDVISGNARTRSIRIVDGIPRAPRGASVGMVSRVSRKSRTAPIISVDIVTGYSRGASIRLVDVFSRLSEARSVRTVSRVATFVVPILRTSEQRNYQG